jgi:hypothetical protein
MRSRPSSLLVFFLIVVFTSSCKKYLDEKPDGSLATPSTIQDLQAMLDNINVLNRAMQLPSISADEYYLTDSDWNAILSPYSHEGYKWELGSEVVDYPDWYAGYSIIYIANTVLESVAKIEVTNENVRQLNAVRGAALFIRSHSLFQLSQIYAKQYDSATASTDLGLPLRLNSTKLQSVLLFRKHSIRY